MNTSLLEFVVDGLQRRKGGWSTIASETGIPYSTVGKIARKEIADPGIRSIERLANHLQLLDRQEAERIQVGRLAAESAR